MGLYFEEEGQGSLPLAAESVAKQVVADTLEFVDCPFESTVELLLTDDEQIHVLNEQFRGIDRATDVLSFPMTEFPQPEQFAGIEEVNGNFDPDSGELLLGNIVISKAKVLAQAAEYGHSIEREYAFLIVHSMLHLLGYDHIEAVEREQMEARQKEIMSHLNILR